MARKRVTPKDLQREIDQYNKYLQRIAFPYPYRNRANGGWQQLEIVYYPETSVKLIERGTSRDCVNALWQSYNELYREAFNGKLIITHVEDLGNVNSKRETGNNTLIEYTDSAHKFVQNIMQSCGYWQIWYTLNGAYYTQTLNQTWK